MKRKLNYIAGLVAMVTLTIASLSFKPEREAIKKIDYYADAKNSTRLLELIKAELTQKRKPVVYFYATWCGPCKQFKNSLTDPLMIDAMRGTTLIMIDADIDATKEKIGTAYNVSSYPTYIRIDDTGKILKQTNGGAWDENIPKNMAPVMKLFLE
jgi:thioredoxin 1